MTTATLRQITDIIAELRDDDPARLYSRARTMRDRGLISTAGETTQGREIAYENGEIVAAVVAINISLNGGPTAQIEMINHDLAASYGALFAEIAAGEPLAVRYDVLIKPWAHTRATLIDLREMEMRFARLDAYGHPHLIVETRLIPLDATVTPVLQRLVK